jgi:carboxypeptidase D
VLGWYVAQQQIPAVDFVHKYEHVFSFKCVRLLRADLEFRRFYNSQTFLSYLDQKNKECNYAGYLDEYLQYPPQGPLPLPGTSTEADPGCDLWTDIFNAALLVNPAFNIYRIFDVVSIVFSSGIPGTPIDRFVVPRSVGCSWFPVRF